MRNSSWASTLVLACFMSHGLAQAQSAQGNETTSLPKPGWRMLECAWTQQILGLPLPANQLLIQVGIELDPALQNKVSDTSWGIETTPKSAIVILTFKKPTGSNMYLLNLLWTLPPNKRGDVSIGIRGKPERVTLRKLLLGQVAVEPEIPQAREEKTVPSKTKKTPGAKPVTDDEKERAAAKLLETAAAAAETAPDFAIARCRRIMRDFPKTNAAKEAKNLLEKLEKARSKKPGKSTSR